MNMQWKGRDLVTVSDLVAALSSLNSEEEAVEFMRQLSEEDVNARANVGYCIGYIGSGYNARDGARRDELWRWTSTRHPAFGQ